jgi:hypothetical protein
MRLPLITALIIAVAPTALADPRAYRGPHPIDLDGNWDFAEELHVHDDLPVGTEPFAEVDGALVFLGDPIAYGWEGAVYTFRGAHPIPASMGRGYCAMTGEHQHTFAPEGAHRRESAGAYVYTGAMRGGYAMVRPARAIPPHPVVRAGVLPPIGTTYFLGGCLHTVIIGGGGIPIAIPVDDCGVVGRVPPRRPPSPPPVRVRTQDFAPVQSRPMRSPQPRSDRAQR